MGEKLDKFLLLMWKNWLLQYRKPIQTIIEIVAPVLFSFLLVYIRSLSDPTYEHERIYKPFCAFEGNFNLSLPLFCNDPDAVQAGPSLFSNMQAGDSNFSLTILYTAPEDKYYDDVIGFFKLIPKVNTQRVISSGELERISLAGNSSYYGIEFGGDRDNVEVNIRFPGETVYQLDSIGRQNWRTNLVYPVFQSSGPRSPDNATGSAPNYFAEGFLAVQHFVTTALLLADKGITHDDPQGMFNFLMDASNPFPLIQMQRFPFASWFSDQLLTALTSMLGMIVMLSFVYTCINTVKSITTEKEKQLKESMKIMGLPNWLHWLAWFVKCFIFVIISVALMVVLLKVRWYSNTEFTVFTYADPFVLFVFLLLYCCSMITFCFALSVFFSKANTAATMAGLAWFISYAPYLFMQNNYTDLALSTKLLTSLLPNTAMAFGFQVVLMYEGTGDGVTWSTLFKPNTPDDTLSLGLIWIMIIINTIIYLLIALYIEAVFPGEYGVAEKWYFPFTKKYWCGKGAVSDYNNYNDHSANEFFETEPNLRPGIQIFNLKKAFGKKTAVRNLSLNMFENQITVLLGHNGAGKTTTMSMLTGMISPTNGTAKINGHDIRLDIAGVRNSLGLCPQHNIIFDELTVEEHLYFFSKLKGLSKSKITAEIDKYVKLLDLEPKRKEKSSTLSGGMKRKLCVGMALCGNSKVVMLDEPTAGMDPSARRVLWELLQKQKEGRTILLSTHFMDEADLLGDRIAIMAGGELQCCGSSFFLKKKYGAGYSLIMDKAKTCNPHKVTELLKKFIPEIEIHSNVGSELTYLLSENNAPVFEAMLKQIEQESNELGIRSYGISLTTMEEVFMKVGADHGQEEIYNEKQKKDKKEKNPILTSADLGPESLSPSYTGGLHLIVNQFVAMLMKKIIGTFRSWVLLAIQIFLPMINVIIVMSVPSGSVPSVLPAMPLNLARFTDPITLIERFDDPQNYTNNFYGVLNGYGMSPTNIDNITRIMLDLTATNPNVVRRSYIIGSTFTEQEFEFGIIKTIHPVITAWFNNDPYHSPGIALGMALSSVYNHYTNGHIEFVNKPLPFKAATQIDNIVGGQSQGFQFAFNIGFSMAFISSFYVIFLIRENVSKSKHLQFVSGVKVYIFWFVNIICDMFVYLLVCSVLLITIYCFQQDGFKTSGDMGRLFFLLLLFGWSFMPIYYVASLIFTVPSTGYTRMTLVGIFIGNAAFLLVEVLKTQSTNLKRIGETLDNVFLVFPHYSLATGINKCYAIYSYNTLCEIVFDSCAQNNFTKDECISKFPSTVADICTNLNDNYFSWDNNGIAKNVTYSLISGVLWSILLFIIEYKFIARLMYYINQKFFPKQPILIQDEDDDVSKEKERIHMATDHDIRQTNILVVKDLTKYYNNFLAVNGLSIGIEKSECFGLLGINGAGKTTTFKMMSGDETVSYGDAWIEGKSVKTQLKQVQRNIGYCPQFDALLDDMTARETIIMYCLLRGIEFKRTQRIANFLSRDFDFHRHLDKKVKEMSGGNKRKLSTVLSLIGDPPVLFLDEPTTGMDPATKRYLWDSLCKIRDNGKCIVLTSHSMEECEALCTRIAIMVNGNFKCLGSTQHLKNKFAEGYTLTIKLKKLPESGGLVHADTESLEKYIKDKFPYAHLREKHQELLYYYITDTSMAWSTMFGILERAKRSDLNIEDYSLGQSSLEQVFLTFTKHQNPEGDDVKKKN
ncbi:phospholipid-transporting ATPase ABCA3-like isoform X2 [Diabrotica virgifera virgifera]|nr:phospholipid-transporting ATPase ABCA3-like isoform X2 [Diabrotica virgifera virgifera]XP_050517581.1 phospholipid-transporting ATPase ABCA3-like isoform X2 [Diabrotica virgifera virgifera]XP_050517582.1 phospholipid-transporting ATPase ABCA3-like isoform X2 [Diabrotica virgifera virgifera]XP_050517583.1 phospholipid-transporting ATPase ABCA3-like isoform X2 [Diabrotica virgifera virgifera]